MHDPSYLYNYLYNQFGLHSQADVGLECVKGALSIGAAALIFMPLAVIMFCLCATVGIRATGVAPRPRAAAQLPVLGLASVL